MLRPITFALLAFTLALPCSAAPNVNQIDRAALEQLKERNDLAWTRRDAAAIAGQYVDDATIRVAPDAELVTGREAIRAFFEANFARREGELRHVTRLDHLDPIGEGAVLSEGGVRVEKREEDGTWKLVRKFRTLTVAVHHGGEWKLRSVRAIPLSQ